MENYIIIGIIALIALFVIKGVVKAIQKGNYKVKELEAKLFTTDGTNKYAGEAEFSLYKNEHFSIEVELKPNAINTQDPVDVEVNRIRIGQATMNIHELELEYSSNPELQRNKGNHNPEIQNIHLNVGDIISIYHGGIEICKGEFKIDR